MKSIQKKKYKIGLTLVAVVFALMTQFTFVKAGTRCDYINPDDPSQNLPLNCDPDAGANPNGNGNPAGANGNTNTTPAGANPNGGIKVNTGIVNPIAGIEDIPSFIEAILNFVLIVGVPIITLAIIYCGFLFVSARGKAEELTKAKKALMYTLIGAALLLGSYVIAHAIKGTVDDIKSTTT